MIFGLLESAAGGLGPAEAVLVCRQLRVPGARLYDVSAAAQEAMAGSSLQLPSACTPAPPEETYICISSSDFAGNSAPVVIRAFRHARSMPSEEAFVAVVEEAPGSRAPALSRRLGTDRFEGRRP